jgi:hypothetical protein
MVMQGVTVRCSVLQCFAVCCSVLQSVAVCRTSQADSDPSGFVRALSCVEQGILAHCIELLPDSNDPTPWADGQNTDLLTLPEDMRVFKKQLQVLDVSSSGLTSLIRKLCWYTYVVEF